MSAEVVQRLVKIAGLHWPSQNARSLIAKTREVLGQYASMEEAYDLGPRSANQLAALNSLERAAENLRRSIESLDVDSSDRLSMTGTDLARLRDELRALDRSVTIVRAQLSGRESRGAPKREARDLTVYLLAIEFQRFAVVNDPDAYSEALSGFLDAACESIEIDLPSNPLDLLPDSVKVPSEAP